MRKGKIITRRIDVDATQDVIDFEHFYFDRQQVRAVETISFCGLAFFRHKVYAYIKDGALNFGKAPRKDTVIEAVYDVSRNR